jgi:hypothetical protein
MVAVTARSLRVGVRDHDLVADQAGEAQGEDLAGNAEMGVQGVEPGDTDE